MSALISIVIPTYQRPVLLKRCLEALMRQDFDHDHFEVVVVDDGADAETRRVVEEMARNSAVCLTYLRQPERRGPAAARNRGWRASTGPIIAFTDDDCIPDENWLKAALVAFQQGANVVSGHVRVPIHTPPTDQERIVAMLEEAEFVTANCFCRRSVLEQVGGLDERFDIAWREDSDLQFRLLETGISITKNRDAVIVHPCRKAPWWACLKDERKNAYDALLYKQHPKLFRERIPKYRRLVLLYYLFVLSFLAGTGLWLAGNLLPATVALVIWGVLLLVLTGRRLRGTAWSFSQFGQTVLTSAVTPFLSVYWRLFGAIKYRALYW
ncbi:glycosyltransferase [Larkinella knui]|uniref:Glycosyltransferase n=1 Tax=Larkinella knui TaxID=2025310 RepID=A0A3P1CXW2_9BACT|nr:glycosyltransferase [Larkinella knui]RRB18133.1 glycosyltransferase [Larkinella knui]